MGYHQSTHKERYLIGKLKSSGESVSTIARMYAKELLRVEGGQFVVSPDTG